MLSSSLLPCCVSGDLEIHHEQRRVLMAGREVELNHGGVCHALLHGQFTRVCVLQSAAL